MIGQKSTLVRKQISDRHVHFEHSKVVSTNKVISQDTYTTNGEEFIVVKNVDECVVILDESTTENIKIKSLTNVFELLLEHELMVTESINNLVDICLTQKDYTTHNFVQWYVSEQLEEEALARTILDKIKLIGEDKGGLYLFDRDLENSLIQSTPANMSGTGA